MNAEQMRDLLRRECEAAGSQAAWAQAHDFSASFVCDVLLGRRDVTESLAKALGHEMRVSYHPIAICVSCGKPAIGQCEAARS